MNKLARQKFNKTRKENIYWYYDSDKKKKYAYRYKYYDHIGKRREKSKQGFETDIAAERALTEIKATILNGGEKIALNENITVEQWIDIYFEHNQSKWKISSIDSYKRVIRLYIKPLFGTYKLSKLTRSLYETEFIEKVSVDKSARSVALYHRFLMGAINAAVEEEIIPKNKLKKANLPKAIKQNNNEVDGNYLTPKELQKLLKCIKHEFNITRYTIILLLANTGMRRGEACALKWTDVDFENKKLSINRTRDFLSERTPKSVNSTRRINLEEPLLSQLKKYEKWCKAKKLSYGITHKDEDYVFISGSCHPLDRNEPSKILDAAAELYNLKRITPHGLRHTFVTILISNNVPVTSIAKIIGDTPQTVLKTYAHSFAEKEKQAMKVLEEIINFD